MNREELEHLKWIYERMVCRLDQNPRSDYMLRFRKILNQEQTRMIERNKCT